MGNIHHSVVSQTSEWDDTVRAPLNTFIGFVRLSPHEAAEGAVSP